MTRCGVLDRYGPDKADSVLPEAFTCFFLLKLPQYSSQDILREKLSYAINSCKSIDTDEYARIDISAGHYNDDGM